MQKSITGFHQDDEGHWVAELECGHTQHVRHNPPWINRPWTTTAEGRTAAIGRCLDCKDCERSCEADNTPAIRRVGIEYASDAVSILREAAAWALGRGILVWQTDELREQDFRAAASSGELVMGFHEGQAVATMLLQSSDPIYWPEIAANTSLFLHKIAVRRAYAGQGWLGRLIGFADQNARQQALGWLRLDTLQGTPLRHLYERQGFSVVDGPPVMHRGRPMIRMLRPVLDSRNLD